MSLQNKIRIIKRVDSLAVEFIRKYPHPHNAFHELSKLRETITQLLEYLSHLDQLAPNYTTNEIDKYMQAINLDMDLLQNEMDAADFKKLQKGVKLMKVVLKFHPAQYSFLEFIVLWVYELIYFI